MNEEYKRNHWHLVCNFIQMYKNFCDIAKLEKEEVVSIMMVGFASICAEMMDKENFIKAMNAAITIFETFQEEEEKERRRRKV